MILSETMKRALDQSFRSRLVNVPELESPVLIVLDYSPSNGPNLLSLAFDCSGGAKCWLTESKVIEIGGEAPRPHAGYKKFVFKGREFHPYSIQAFPQSVFENIQEFRRACRLLYQHIAWS